MRCYRLLLRLYPASFRAEYGDEMCAVFAARRREVNPIAFWAEAITDVIINAARVPLTLLQEDLRWAARVLWKSPGFTLAPAQTTGTFTDPGVALTVPCADTAFDQTGKSIVVRSATNCPRWTLRRPADT